MAHLSGKVIIVTGASAGIGAAIAKNFVENGAKVVGLARRVERMEALAKELENQPGKLYPIQADLTKEEDILNAFKWTTEHVGPLDVLINNAGTLRYGSIIDGTTSNWKMIVDLNLIAAAIGCREAIKIMKANNTDGYIINVNSTAGHSVPRLEGLNIYPPSKHALKVFTENLRRELAIEKSKIRVSEISPGGVGTEIGFVSGMATEEFLKNINLDEINVLDCFDVVHAVSFMLSTSPKAHVTELILRPVGELD